MKTMKDDTLLLLSKEELAEKLKRCEKEIAVQHDLLKQTFLQNQELQRKCAELQKILDETNGDSYNSSISWVSKIVLILKTENKPLRSAELIAILERKESMLQNHHSKAKFFSSFLNGAVKYKRIIPQKVNGVRGFYYLLPEWIDELGNVKHPFKEMMV